MSATGTRWVLFGVLAACAAVPGARFLRAFWLEYASFCHPRMPVDTQAAQRRIPGLLPVAWQGPAGAVRGWFVAGTEPAGVVVLHGSSGSRTDVVDEVAALAAGGFSVLAFDWPGQGESEGCSQWDELERATLGTAVDWLAARPELAGGRIGAFGFSLGGYPLVQRAVSDERIAAVALAATPGDAAKFARWEFRAHGRAGQSGALLAMRARGMHADRLVPNEVVGRLAPRPLLVVVGSADENVPPAMVRELFDAAREPRELLVIPGAGHGKYSQAAPTVYADRLTNFFSHALLAHSAAGGSE